MVTHETLREIMGDENVSAEPSVLESYASDNSFVGRVVPRFVVRVDGCERVQALVRLAQETATPLVPVSSDGPRFYGDTVPTTGDAVIVDLSGMKRIDLIERRERVASVVEPGVTFGELIPAAAEQGLRLNMPLQPRATKSVVGSMLSREPVIMPRYHWDISDPIGSTEVVFGTGDMFRTGAAAGPGNIEEQRASGGRQKEAAGPSAMSLHRLLQGAQGTMGIVTWASVRCELIPELEQPFFVASDDAAKLLEAAHWLIRLRLANELLILNRADLAALMLEAGADYTALRDGLPRWILFFSLAAYEYLPEMRMSGQIEDTEELFQRLGLELSQTVGALDAAEFLEAIRHPAEELYWKLRPEQACQDIFFLTTNARIPGLIKSMTEVAEAAGYPAGKMGVYIQPLVQGSNLHVEFNLFYDPTDAMESALVRTLAVDAIPSLMEAGAFFSRPFGEAAGWIMNRDAASVDVLKKFKNIVDPAGILNPGKLCF